MFSWWGEGRCPVRGRKNGDRHHMPSMADRAIAQRFSGQFFVEVAVVGWSLRRDNSAERQDHAQQLAAQGELGLAITVAQKAVVPDALKAVGQDMQQETANEFVGFQCHGFLLVAMPIIFPAKTHLAVVDVEQSVTR